MSDEVCMACGHRGIMHGGNDCVAEGCGCHGFIDATTVQTKAAERIAVALESIARSLDAMRRDGR